MPRPLLTVLASDDASPAEGVERIRVDVDDAAAVDAALATAAAPVAVRLPRGATLASDAAATAAEAASRQPHRRWWWSLDEDTPTPRADLASLLLRHADTPPVALFRPTATLARGGFARHGGPALDYANACGLLANGLAPGLLPGPLLGPGNTEDPDAARVDRVEIAAAFADRCTPADRDRVWASCRAATGSASLRFPVEADRPLRRAA